MVVAPLVIASAVHGTSTHPLVCAFVVTHAVQKAHIEPQSFT